VLRFTHFGRDVYAVGGNFQAARLSGIRTTRVTVSVYAICVLFLGTLSNGLAISGVPSYWQQILSGLIVAGAAVSEIVQREGFRR
jgi:ribose transport system permease protein